MAVIFRYAVVFEITLLSSAMHRRDPLDVCSSIVPREDAEMPPSRNIGTVLLRIATLAVAPVQNVGDEVRMYLYMRTSKDGSVLQCHARHCELACLLELYRKLNFELSLSLFLSLCLLLLSFLSVLSSYTATGDRHAFLMSGAGTGEVKTDFRLGELSVNQAYGCKFQCACLCVSIELRASTHFSCTLPYFRYQNCMSLVDSHNDQPPSSAYCHWFSNACISCHVQWKCT